LQNKRSYREIGDLILTYAHSIKTGVGNALLQDYYTGLPIRVKLDTKLNAAENARKYYKKSQNEVIEKEQLNSTINQTEKLLFDTQKLYDELLPATEFTDLKKQHFVKKEQSIKIEIYKEIEYLGIKIWLGKNAKSNDAMLKKAGKNDLWLHARGCAGSHVIVRTGGKTVADEIIAYAAQLAARNSKAKTQKIVPVYCIERKFVSKPKHAAPGEVVVLKETVVDAFLK
jgi:predicted ribosome quality control (RQC) complex YloA/Tae2 family protein